MYRKTITPQHIQAFIQYLQDEEKSSATMEKYERDVRYFAAFVQDKPVTKELTVAYKHYLINQGYAVRSINSMIAGINSFFTYLGWHECRVKSLKQQREVYCAEEKELSKAEYEKLLRTARKNGKTQMDLVMQTICATGIRVSELSAFTVEAVRTGRVQVHCKNKLRTIFVPGKLCKVLLQYAKKLQIQTGPIFLSKTGTPLSRSSIWAQMKRLCHAAGVSAGKVFPHNLRKLFARTFYAMEKDIAKLADLLGHSSIDTTRIYIISTGLEHRRQIERLGLLIGPDA